MNKLNTPLACCIIALLGCLTLELLAAEDANSVGIVSEVKVLSDKVPDVSSIDAWKKSYIKDGMTDEQKAIAVWETVATFQHQDGCANEYLQYENCVVDPIKTFNVYGHAYCGMAAAHSSLLARYIGLESRGWTIPHHVINELKYDNAWHLMDSSLICYFPKADGKAASVEELIAGTKEWFAKNPGFTDKDKDGKEIANDAKLRAFQKEGNWQGWKKGPEIFLKSPQLSDSGWIPGMCCGWYALMECYDGSTLFPYEMASSQGYRVNIQLRKGEKLTRNWSHKNLCMEGLPGCRNSKVGEGDLAYSAKMFKDLAPGRIGNGTLEYDVPLATGEFKSGALQIENLASKADDKSDPAVHLADAAKDGSLIIRMPCSYVYHTGQLALKSVVPPGGEISVQLSDNNGLDWKDVAKITDSGDKTIDLKKFVFLRYDYRLKFVFKGKGTGLDALKITHDIQHSQRPLPALDKGENKLHFSAGTEGTVTIEPSVHPANKDKQVILADFHPTATGAITVTDAPVVSNGAGDLTFPIETPGDMRRIRFGTSGRVNDKHDKWTFQVSFDDGKTFKTVDTLQGPARFASKWMTFADVPAGTRKALVRYAGEGVSAAMLFGLRIDADYTEPHSGFKPIKITYTWEENGQIKQDAHIAKQANEDYTITCGEKPLMKSITLEWAE
jgi:hypothetical protein